MKKTLDFQKYSVLMSVYYKENPVFLSRSIDSLMAQTIKPDDIVVVCDGPLTDELYSTLDLCQLRYNNLQILKKENNEGLGKSLAYGILFAKNEIIMRMDSDDVCLPFRAEKQLQLMSSFDLVGGYVSEFETNEQNIIGIRKVPENFREIKRYAKTRCPFNHPTVMFKRNLVLSVGNYEHLKYLEDYLLWIKILKKSNRVYNLQEILVNMRSGYYMRARRGGKEYLESYKKLRKKMFKESFINVLEYIFVTPIQLAFLSLPISAKEKLYRKVLRTNK